jgi:2-polyprenyl-6-hydroxyphenyl methylase / 3-demethylubiquinone-9 3-methyltransferase
METATTINPEEVARFSALAEQWWDPRGKFAPLHRINPVRLTYIREKVVAHFARDANAIRVLEGLSVLDIGCGGGLVAEPMARLGGSVTAIDASEKNIKTASLHAEQSQLTIDYQATTAEALAAQGRQYDLVLALEVIEHVADLPTFFNALYTLLKPGGLLILSTLNRTPKSYALAILGAEYILRWLPIGTHDWKKFLKPHEVIQPLQRLGLTHLESCGMVMHPLTFEWRMEPKDLAVNYYTVFHSPLAGE